MIPQMLHYLMATHPFQMFQFCMKLNFKLQTYTLDRLKCFYHQLVLFVNLISKNQFLINFLITFLVSSDFSVTACIRRQDGYCCIQYSVCANEINAFSLDSKSLAADSGDFDTACIMDYTLIAGNFFYLCFGLSIEPVRPIIGVAI